MTMPESRLINGLTEGDDSVINGLVLYYTPHAKRIAARYRYRAGVSNKDDVEASAVYGLVDALHRACEKRLTKEHILPYITVVIKRHIKDYIDRSHLIRLPRRELKRRVDGDHQIPTIEHGEVQQYTLDYNLEEYYEALDLDFTERCIVEMRMAGYTTEEIGGEMFRSGARIRQILAVIRKRYNTLLQQGKI